MLRGAAREEEPGHCVLRVVRHPDKEGADGDQVGQRQPQLLAVDVDAGPSKQKYNHFHEKTYFFYSFYIT